MAVLAFYLAKRIRRERLSKLYWDVVASTGALREWPPDLERRLWKRGWDEADVLVLQGACLANLGDLAGATRCFELAESRLGSNGHISGRVALWLPQQVEPIEFGTSRSATNLTLVRGHLAVLQGRAAEVLQWLHARLHEPHYAAALCSLADAYRLAGFPARATAILRMELFRVTNYHARHLLRYRLAELLESLGAQSEAAIEFRVLASEAPNGDAPRRLAALEARMRDERALLAANADAAAYRSALLDFEAARGPVSRDQALARGLASLLQPHLREQLVLEASRLEVQAVLDKVDTLKTKGAKSRNLHEALARIRTDQVPDHLQAAEIAELERALAHVEAS